MSHQVGVLTPLNACVPDVRALVRISPYDELERRATACALSYHKNRRHPTFLSERSGCWTDQFSLLQRHGSSLSAHIGRRSNSLPRFIGTSLTRLGSSVSDLKALNTQFLHHESVYYSLVTLLFRNISFFLAI